MVLNESGELEVKTIYAITNGAPESEKTGNFGCITFDKASALEGETVTVTVMPNEGYVLTADSLQYNDGNTDTVITATEGVYRFAMPAKAVTVTAAFAGCDIRSQRFGCALPSGDAGGADLYSCGGLRSSCDCQSGSSLCPTGMRNINAIIAACGNV